LDFPLQFTSPSTQSGSRSYRKKEGKGASREKRKKKKKKKKKKGGEERERRPWDYTGLFFPFLPRAIATGQEKKKTKKKEGKKKKRGKKVTFRAEPNLSYRRPRPPRGFGDQRRKEKRERRKKKKEEGRHRQYHSRISFPHLSLKLVARGGGGGMGGGKKEKEFLPFG